MKKLFFLILFFLSLEPPSQAPCWSNIVKAQPPPKPHHHQQALIPPNLPVGSCKSSKGISIAVVDATAIIQGGEQLTRCADKFVSVSEVIDEVRDPVSRHKLAFVPFTIDTMEPSPESLKKVINFARATGDLQTLSDVDLKLIALTYMLEAQIHGTKHLRDSPPPIHAVNVKRLPEKDMPGWGSNVPNLEEWEALEHEVEDGSNPNSRILPLTDLNLNVIPADDHSENEIKIEGKKMVADGVDASQGQYGDNAGDWLPAVSRSTHRRYLRRKARHELHEASLGNGHQHDAEENMENNIIEDTECADELMHESPEGKLVGNGITEESGTTGGKEAVEEDEVETIDERLDHLEISSQMSESVDVSYIDDESSEQSWMLKSLSDSSVACVTSDFAMQNVLLQMGLRLLAPGGMQIRQLHRWILKCHACNEVTAEIGRIFCPRCGNGGTLRKVAVTVGENGIILAARKPRISLRGTKFSLPLPRGGRDAITKNPILREDQLPHKLLHPKTKKKANKPGDEFFASDDFFSHHTDKKTSLRPPVREALAVFSGKRNPNDNHFSRSKR
ncbi:unnamed protein product, partial [Vitis vinifera]